MNHQDHVNLLKPAGLGPGGVWADLGAGTGAFTLALRETLGPDAEIHAVDRDRGSLEALKRAFERQFGSCQNLQVDQADIRGPLDLPPFDGVLMANSLHFFREKVRILSKVREMLKPMGQLILIEYNVDNGNAWVPFPISFGRLPALLAKAGFEAPRLLAKHPSSFLREFYSALARRR